MMGATETSAIVPRDDLIDNLATELSAVTLRRLASLLELRHHGMEEDTFLLLAFEEFEGLRAELREVLLDREWDGLTVGPSEQA